MIPKAESTSRRHHERKPVSLLLLEDDPRFAELLGTRVRKMPWAELRLEVAGSLAAALARLAAEPFDLVLCDLNLPDSSGLATLEALSRAGEQLIIVLTGDPNPALRASAMEAGAYDFVSKDDLGPATLERLVRLATIQATAGAQPHRGRLGPAPRPARAPRAVPRFRDAAAGRRRPYRLAVAQR